MSDLTDFLLARIAEDEAAATTLRDVDAAEAAVSERDLSGYVVTDGTGLILGTGRVLAECEAKRRIVTLFEDERKRRDIYNRDYDSSEYDLNDNDLRARLASNSHCRGLEEAMLALALPYADHPGYREEWKP